MGTDPKATVERYLQALEDRDYEAARACLAGQGFRYESPIASYTRAEDLLDHAMVGGSIVQQRQVVKCFVDGPDVCHFLRYCIQLSDKQQIDLAHWAQVEQGRILRIVAIFDAYAYWSMFEDLEPQGKPCKSI
ncbi:nuclear transport factor 2 family protein [Halorhodospira halophila]|nr:nuclear transport factor 2 family protein [Halorhodospira halophila]